MAKLTDKQRKKIVADYVETQNYSKVAKQHKVSWTTVKNIVSADDTTLKKLEHKKEENTQDVLSYMDSKAEGVKAFLGYVIDKRLNPLSNQKELDNTPINDLLRAYGIVIDKELKNKELSLKNKTESNTEAIIRATDELKKVLQNPVPVRELPDNE